MRIRESVLVEKLSDWLHYCDAGDFAELVSKAFGGDCYISPDQPKYLEAETIYEFEPNDSYADEFEGLEEEITQ